MKKIKIILITLLVLTSTFTLFSYNSLDGIKGLICEQIVEEYTVYAVSYSDKDFKKIKTRMTTEEVKNILGEPLYSKNYYINKYQSDIDRWWYSKSPGSTHYRMREIRFKDSKVIEKVSYF